MVSLYVHPAKLARTRLDSSLNFAYDLHMPAEMHDIVMTLVAIRSLVRLEVLTMVNIQFEVFWVVAMCNVAVVHECFKSSCLHLQDKETGAGKKGKYLV